MRLLAAFASAAFAALVVAALSGDLPRGPIRRRGGPRAGAAADAERSAARATWLAQAGVTVGPRRFVAGSVGLGALAGALVLAVTATPAVALAPAVAAGWAPRLVLARRRSRRLRRLQEAWPDGIRDLAASVAAGLSLHRALDELAHHGPPALREAFARYPALARVVGTVPALEVIQGELADPTSDRVIEVLVLAHERGGRLLVDVLRDLADATTRDVRALERIETEGLEQRLNARVVFVLPWLVLLALTASPGPMRDFYRSPLGLAVVLVGALMSLGGLAVVTRLGRDPIEPRVVARSADVAGDRP